MRIIKRRERIKGVSKRWDKQYPGAEYGIDKLGIGHKLRDLNLSRVSAKKVNDIIGNNSWTSNDCSECEKDKLVVIRFLEKYEDEYECNSCDVCLDCLKKAIAIAEKKGRTKQ